MEAYIVYLGIILTLCACVNSQDTLHKSVLTEIFTNYDQTHVPLKSGSSSDTVTVKYGLSIRDIINFDLFTGIGEFVFQEYIGWTDYRLSWDPLAHGNVTELRVLHSDIWNPHMTLYNTLNHEDQRKSTKVAVYSDGTVLYGPHMIQKARCDVNPVTNTTVCKLKFGTWGHDGKHIRLTHYFAHNKMDTSLWDQHRTQFIIKKNEAVYNQITYPCCPGVVYPDITYTLTMDHSKKIRSAATGLKALPAVTLIVILVQFLY